MADQLKGLGSGVQNTVTSGAETVGSGAQKAASTTQSTVTEGATGAKDKVSEGASSVTSGSGKENWDKMTEEQKKQTYDALPSEKKEGLSYTEWIKQGYHNKMENWMPWVEDLYLRWFTSDNKASYATKDTLDKSKVTGIEQVDTLQDSVNSTAASQVGQGGLLQPLGDAVSKEGVNRAERGGKDDTGSYAAGADKTASSGGGITGYASSAGSGVYSGVKGAGSYVGSMFGGKKE